MRNKLSILAMLLALVLVTGSPPDLMANENSNMAFTKVQMDVEAPAMEVEAVQPSDSYHDSGMVDNASIIDYGVSTEARPIQSPRIPPLLYKRYSDSNTWEYPATVFNGKLFDTEVNQANTEWRHTIGNWFSSSDKC